MAVQFKTVERGQPGVSGGGTKKFYAIPVQDRELSLDDLTSIIERTSTVNGADIRAVLYAMVIESVSALSKGQIVRLGDLGSLRITLSSEGTPTAEEFTAANIKNAGVIFTPGPKLKDMLAAVKYTKVG